jgi:shikimate dehydrogenase
VSEPLHRLKITAATQVVGVIGDPVRHSMSPVLHNAAFAALGLDWAYVAFPVAASQGGSVVAAMKTFGIDGLSVTMPHKEAAASGADVVSDDAALLGAANTLVREGDIVRALSTDGEGCVNALRAAGCDPAGKRCVVVGAGGAGRAVVLGLARAGASEIVVVNRSADRAARAVACGLGRALAGSIEAVADAELVVNATPIGMGANTDAVVPAHLLRPGQWVNDLVYHPLETPLLTAAAAVGARPVGGLGMLIHQGALQFRAWTGFEAPIDVMTAAAHAALAGRARN